MNLTDYNKEKQENETAFVEQPNQDIIIYVDTREKSSKTLRTLYELPLTLRLERLDIGDYQLSDDVVVEFKRVSDFVGSLIDGRLLEQVKKLKASTLKPLIIIEGEQSLFGQRNISPNAIFGMLATITVSYRIPILFTKNENETANLLFVIAKREQQTKRISKPVQLHALKPKSEKEQLLYIVSSIPQVGPSAAHKLLLHFRTIANLANATVDDIAQVEGIGKHTAKHIFDFLHKDFNSLSQ
jgi:ERCC4-type nuclease